MARQLTVSVGRKVNTTLSWLRCEADARCEGAWTRQFMAPQVRGHHFLVLKSLKDIEITPTAAKSGQWIPRIDESPTLTARAVHCITNHAPMGSYYARFKPLEPTACPCGSPRMDRLHILARCRLFKGKSVPSTLVGLVRFLKDNPAVFSFTRPRNRAGYG